MSPNMNESPEAHQERGEENGARHPQKSNGVGLNSPPTQNGGQTSLLARDATNSLAVIGDLEDTDVVLILTPSVPQVSGDPDDTSDPFECFGRALESRHHRIRHRSYQNSSGITGIHRQFIIQSNVIILVLADGEAAGQMPQINVEHAHITVATAGEDTRVIIVVADSSSESWQRLDDFPTVIQAADYSPASLERTVSVIFREF
ncbi:hypothetical protein VC83_07851 [Pseudogymnoascus destructans]|uniref:Uncharacterized protein n=2 Tax=Pseudogymnoascus destructans TaxID=655981 RepID=L8FMN8_PSED2|nr:uncharacterized protein VC83_07851 [Pseudogymnoascus destructans]ELR02215.1 hypothetical protein GMDG_01008 [Pseudogymnoascus destructans 20631-21]OAF55820.1 hypothetical protein VC83_07851 [Pseudogymnoascus destructans]